MADIIPFRKKTGKKTGKKPASGSGNILCRNNHHRWRVIKDSEFDTKKGRLVTVERCSRCGKQRHRLT